MLRLIGLGFCLLLAGAQDPADKDKALIEKLESDSLEERETATKDLNRIGFRALPALRETSAHSEGNAKRLIDRVIDRISAFGAPVQVSIQAIDRPLREIAAELERQTLIPIRLVGSAADA